jgi:isochorismate pyruvate lyase
MQSANQCKNMDEIRTAIDHLDHQLVSLLSQRAEYVHAAARFKTNAADVRASDRVKTMLAKRRTWAQDTNIDPEFIEELFRKVVNYFIQKEMGHWQKEPKR